MSGLRGNRPISVNIVMTGLRALLFAWVLCLPVFSAPLLVNGDFETGDLSSWGGSGVVTCFTDPALAHSGNSGAAFFAFLSPAELFQDIPTVIGHQYRVEFFAATAEVPFSASFGAVFGGQSQAGALSDTYQLFSFVVTATSTLSRLSFLTAPDPLGSTADVFLLDDVSVTDLAAPELDSAGPTAPIFLLVWLGLLQARRTRPPLARSWQGQTSLRPAPPSIGGRLEALEYNGPDGPSVAVDVAGLPAVSKIHGMSPGGPDRQAHRDKRAKVAWITEAFPGRL